MQTDKLFLLIFFILLGSRGALEVQENILLQISPLKGVKKPISCIKKIYQVVKFNKYIHSSDAPKTCTKGAGSLGLKKKLLQFLFLVYCNGYWFSWLFYFNFLFVLFFFLAMQGQIYVPIKVSVSFSSDLIGARISFLALHYLWLFCIGKILHFLLIIVCLYSSEWLNLMKDDRRIDFLAFYVFEYGSLWLSR